MTDLFTTRPGQIVSFYSFKGGVGRTMALANVAFMAAMNGLDVLVMDWDLEAPGLHHYFRGLVEPDEMSHLRSAPGILDLAWEWRNGIDQAEDAEAIDKQFARFRQGDPFEEVVRTILSEQEYVTNGCLDIIPAGGDLVAAPEPVEYERALAAMSWNELLELYAGGGMIDALRRWAADNYDLILVDSRTGLADVSGICTMQLPDAVVLCFVLNRQNIEGVARVTSAIKGNRGDELRLWTVPMRVSREGTDEEADATARALRELTRPGRLNKETTEHQLKHLLIKAEPNVPFMESLSAFNETNAALDPLSANLARLATEIVGRPIEIPVISEQWRDLVKNRLAPSLSTDSYLRQLLTAEPARAARQLHGYVESAISTFVEGDELPTDYVAALAETVLAMQQRGDLSFGDDYYDTLSRMAHLLRKLHDRDNETWRPLLIQALETSITAESRWIGDEDELVGLDEIDDLLAAEPQDIATLERRATMRIRAAQIYGRMGSYLQQLGASEDALSLLRQLKKASDAPLETQATRLEALVQRAAAQERLEQLEEATETLHKLMDGGAALEGTEFDAEGKRYGAEAAYRLMRLLQQAGDARAAQNYGMAAIARSQPNTPLFATRIADFADAVLAVEPVAPAALELLSRAVLPPAQTRAYAHYYGRAPSGSVRLIVALGNLFRAVSHTSEPPLLSILAERALDIVTHVTTATADRTLALQHRRRGVTSSIPRASTAFLEPLAEAIEWFVGGIRSASLEPGLEPAIVQLEMLAAEIKARAGELYRAPGSRTNS